MTRAEYTLSRIVEAHDRGNRVEIDMFDLIALEEEYDVSRFFTLTGGNSDLDWIAGIKKGKVKEVKALLSMTGL